MRSPGSLGFPLRCAGGGSVVGEIVYVRPLFFPGSLHKVIQRDRGWFIPLSLYLFIYLFIYIGEVFLPSFRVAKDAPGSSQK